jgi:DNA-binding phage protein
MTLLKLMLLQKEEFGQVLKRWNGLVDKIGGLDAIKEAAVLGKQKIYNTLSRIQQRC